MQWLPGKGAFGPSMFLVQSLKGKKSKCRVVIPRFANLPGSSLGYPSLLLAMLPPLSLSSAFSHHLLSERPASTPRRAILKIVTALKLHQGLERRGI